MLSPTKHPPNYLGEMVEYREPLIPDTGMTFNIWRGRSSGYCNSSNIVEKPKNLIGKNVSLIPDMCMTLNIGGGRSSGYGLLRILQCLSITSTSNLYLLHSYFDFRKYQRIRIIKGEKDIFGKRVAIGGKAGL